MAQLYSRSKVPYVEELISFHVARFVQKIRGTGPLVDLVAASRALEADIMCKLNNLNRGEFFKYSADASSS